MLPLGVEIMVPLSMPAKTVENMMDQDDSIKHSVELLNEQLSQVME